MIPKSTLYQKAREDARHKTQREWTTSQKASATTQYTLTVQDKPGSKKIADTKNISSGDWARDDEIVPKSVSPE